jgi:dTDP-4-amino-4,6-dideoxygalactose transaminase
VFHQYTLVLNDVDRNGLNEYLATKEIPSMIYYPVPAHRQKMFSSFGAATADLPVTDWLTQRVISLPIHTEMEEEQLQHITTQLLAFVNK